MGESFAFMGDIHVGEAISDRLLEAGFSLADAPAEADYLITYCLTQTQLEDLYLGSSGAIETAKEGCCLVDLSPSTPTLAKEIYAVARVSELQALDAPLVLGDPCVHDAFGDAGNLTMLVGGEGGIFEEALPLLSAIAGEVRYLGLPGMGQLSKALCTLQQLPALVSLVEARAMGKVNGEAALPALEAAADAGIVPRRALSVFAAMVEGHFHGTYSCQVLLAELSAVMNGAEEAELVLPQAEACQHLLELFLVVGGADLPAPALSLVYADEEECAPFGIDWTRAEGIYGREDHDHGDEEDEFDLGFDDEDGYAGGFGGFSSN